MKNSNYPSLHRPSSVAHAYKLRIGKQRKTLRWNERKTFCLKIIFYLVVVLAYLFCWFAHISVSRSVPDKRKRNLFGVWNTRLLFNSQRMVYGYYNAHTHITMRPAPKITIITIIINNLHFLNPMKEKHVN